MNDRRVHAETRLFSIVRYEKAGKWYVEPKDKHIPRRRIGIGEAARRAVDAREILGGTINFGVAGGKVFDRLVLAHLEVPA